MRKQGRLAVLFPGEAANNKANKMRPSAQIYPFPAPQAVVARPGASFQKIRTDLVETQLYDARRQMRAAILGAIACGAVTMMCSICAYVSYVAAIIAQSAILWGFATAMLIVGGFFVHIGWREHRDYRGFLMLYRGAMRNV